MLENSVSRAWGFRLPFSCLTHCGKYVEWHLHFCFALEPAVRIAKEDFRGNTPMHISKLTSSFFAQLMSVTRANGETLSSHGVTIDTPVMRLPKLVISKMVSAFVNVVSSCRGEPNLRGDQKLQGLRVNLN